MDPFEYVMVLTSLILGLGITQILTGVANLILRMDIVKFYLPHTLWIILTFGFHVQEWWFDYEYATSVKVWRLMDFLFLVLYPIMLFILARLLFPSNLNKGEIDLKVFYYANYRKIFLITLFLPAVSIPQNILVSSIPLQDQLIQIGLGVLLAIFLLFRTTNKYLHHAFAFIMTFIALGYLLIYDPYL